jgi:hypothetical protein
MALGACSLLLPFGEYSDGESPDGASSAKPSGDAAPDRDAAGSSDAANVYPPDSWCATQPRAGLVVCDDFDFELTLGQRWSGTTFDIAGAAVFDTDAFVSPPKSFAMQVPVETSDYVQVMLNETLDGGAPVVTFAFDLRPDMLTTSNQGVLYVASIEQGPGRPRSALSFRIASTFADLQEQITDSMGNNLTPFPMATITSGYPAAGTFTRVSIQLDFTRTPAVASVTLGTATSTAATLSLDPSWSVTTTTFHLGDWFIAPTQPFSLEYDNAVIRAP